MYLSTAQSLMPEMSSEGTIVSIERLAVSVICYLKYGCDFSSSSVGHGKIISSPQSQVHEERADCNSKMNNL